MPRRTIATEKVGSTSFVRWAKVVALYGGSALLTLVFAASALRLREANFAVPFYYSLRGDATWSAMFTKGIMDNGWFEHNPYLGAPDGLYQQDFPMPETLHFLLIRLLALFSWSPGAVLNAFFLLTFPLTTMSALYVLRQFGVSVAAGVTAGILYAFLPSHVLRGEFHLMLAAYYLVPLIVMVCLWICSGALTERRGLKALLSVVICALAGAGGVYYAFFACFFLLLAGFLSFSRARTSRALLVPALLALVIVVSLGMNLAPSWIYWLRNGANPVVMQRDPSEGESYSLRIGQLLLPVSNHRLPAWAELRASYNRLLGSWHNESDNSTLGAIGACGFLGLLGVLFWRPATASLLYDLALLNIGAVLLAISSGFGPLMQFLFVREIRAYNRISVYIGFFALFAIALAADRLARFCRGRIWSRALYYGFLCAVLLLGVVDQTPISLVPDYRTQEAEFDQDAVFVRRIEKIAKPGTMIFQLPYVQFPESPSPHNMRVYDHFLPYLHSWNLRWSFGAMKNRPTDLWQQRLAAEAPAELVETLALAGFSGLYIDRNGYADHGHAIETQFASILKTPAIVHTRGTAVFFDLSNYLAAARERIGPQEWPRRQDEALHPVLIGWGRGFFGLEGAPGDTWRWAGSSGELMISNFSRSAKPATIDMTLSTGLPEPADLTIEGPGFSSALRIAQAPTQFSKTFQVPVGRSQIHIVCHGRPLLPQNDPRALVFRVHNFALRDSPI